MIRDDKSLTALFYSSSQASVNDRGCLDAVLHNGDKTSFTERKNLPEALKDLVTRNLGLFDAFAQNASNLTDEEIGLVNLCGSLVRGSAEDSRFLGFGYVEPNTAYTGFPYK